MNSFHEKNVIEFRGAVRTGPWVPWHPLGLNNGCQAPVLRTAFSLKNYGFRENHEKQVTYSAFANFWHPSCSESNCAPVYDATLTLLL